MEPLICIVGVIALCRASPPMVLRTYVISHMVMCLESVCISWPWCIYHFTVLNMAVSQFTTFTFFEAVHESRCMGLRAENTTGAQIDRHDVYLTCHVEILEKGWVISKNQLSKGSRRYIYG
jgi:hypothetical protein